MAEEQEQYRPNYGYYPMQPKQPESDRTIKWKIDPEDVIEQLMHYLRGDKLNNETLQWEPQGFIYHFDVKAPLRIHHTLLKAESEGLLRFDNAVVDEHKLIGYYSVFDFDSFGNLMAILEQAKGELTEKESMTYHFRKTEPQRLMNEEGIRVLTTKLRGYLNKNIKLSRMDNKMILEIAKQAAFNTIKLIYSCYDTYNIKRENFDTILELVDINIYASLKSAEDGSFLNHLSTTQRYIEQSNVTTQEKAKAKGGVMSIFGNWGKKGED